MITLVAVVTLFVIGAMAALSIDVVSIYTARSEAQLAADGAALAGARALANSGMTSDPNAASDNLATNAEALAQTVALQIAQQNPVGGANLTAAEVTVTFPNAGSPDFVTNPQVNVKVQDPNLPTFFARIWGRRQFTVGASATAEAYNPSGAYFAGVPTIPVAPVCVKPWLLPNISPNPGPTNPRIFDPAAGTILDTNLLGWSNGPGTKLRTDCTTCTANSPPAAWRYYPGTTDAGGSFPPPLAASCTGCGGFTPYQLSIAGCVQTPISCTTTVNIDANALPNRDTEAGTAVNNLTNSTANAGDTVDTAAPPSPPFQFLAGGDNPIVQSGALASQSDIMVSPSLVTVPVVNVDTATPIPLAGFPAVQIIGFVQLFVNPTGQADQPPNYHILTEVVNMAGCGTGAAGTPTILGNGASPVAVRLISP